MSKKGTDIVHALRFNQKATPRIQTATVATWLPDSLAILNRVRNQAAKHLESVKGKKVDITIPSASLRMRMQLIMDSLITTASHMALTNNNLFNHYKANGKELAAFHRAENTKQLLDETIESWLENELTVFIETYEVAEHLRESLYDLLDDGKFYELNDTTWQMFPWSQSDNGTAKPNNKFGYAITANEIAQLLEGQTLFGGLQPVKRIVGSGDLGHNRAELITPIINDAAEGTFSMVCSISIETLPTVSYPLICVDIHRRRWVAELSTDYTQKQSTSGFLFCKESDRAYRYSVSKVKGDDGKYFWCADDGWEVLTKKHSLPYELNANDILRFAPRHDVDIGIAFINELEGTHEKGQHGIHVGCTETDRVHVFKNVSAVLAEHGFECFDDFRIVGNHKKSGPELAYLDWQSVSNFLSQRQLVESVSDDDLPLLTLQEQEGIFNEVMAQWADAIEVLEDKGIARLEKVDRFLSVTHALANTATQQSGEKITLLLVTENVDQQPLIKTIAAKLFGNNIEIVTAALPANVHGPKKVLPASDKGDLERIYERIGIWEAFIERALKGRKGQTLCLVQASQFYEGKQPDDKINKPAAKIALTKNSNVPVQYLLPVDNRHGSRKKQIVDYVHRIQSALLDLYFGHQGLVPKIPELIQKNLPGVCAPAKYLYGIRVLKVNGRAVNKKSSEIAVASRVDTTTGVPMIKFGHGSSKVELTDWMSFTAAIGYITNKFNAQLTLKVGNYYLSRQNCFQQFFNNVLDEANQYQGFVFVDAVQCRGLCSWLADSGVPANGLATIDGKWNNLRLIRVRTQSPEIMVEKYNDEYDAHTTCQRLIRVEQGEVPIYWSLGLPMNHVKRGRSVYRTTPVEPKKDDDKTELEALHTTNTSTPNAVEFAFLNLVEGDKTDDIAKFTTGLRTGVLQANQRWVQLPAPLFIAAKLTEYLRI